MVEGSAVADSGTEIAADSWVHEHEGLSDEDKQTLSSKYKTHDEALTGSAHATRKFAEYDEQLKSAVNWPDDKTSDEDKATFDGKVNAYRKVPDKPDGYEIDRSAIPEGIEYDEEMEKVIREAAHKGKGSQAAVKEVVDAYIKTMVSRHKAMEKVAKEGEQTLRDDPNFDFDAKIGKEGKDEPIGTIKSGLLQLSKELDMDYTDDAGDFQSHLIDALEFIRPGGSIGDKIPLVKALDALLNYRYAEGTTLLGQPAGKGKGGEKAGAFGTEGFYEKTDAGEDV